MLLKLKKNDENLLHFRYFMNQYEISTMQTHLYNGLIPKCHRFTKKNMIFVYKHNTQQQHNFHWVSLNLFYPANEHLPFVFGLVRNCLKYLTNS